MDLSLYKAKVIDIDDKDKKGKIKIQVLPELKDVQVKDLPWALPFSSFNSSSVFSNSPLEVNSLIWVLIDPLWKRFYYIGNMYFYNLFDFDSVKNVLDSASEISNKDYKNLSFRMFQDGGLEFHNNSTGEHGFIHKSGSYSIFDKDGKIYFSGKNITLKDDNGNVIETTTSSVKINNNFEVLQ